MNLIGLKDLQIIMNNSISHYQICIWKLAFHGNRIILALVCSFSEICNVGHCAWWHKESQKVVIDCTGLARTDSQRLRSREWELVMVLWPCEATPWSCPMEQSESAAVDGRIFLQLQSEWYFYTFVYVAS